MLDVSAEIAESAGNLRGHYPSLKAMDAIQIAVSINAGADAFITNDEKLRQIKDQKLIILKDYL